MKNGVDVKRNQRLLMCLDLIVDLNYQMNWWDEEVKSDGAARNSP